MIEEHLNKNALSVLGICALKHTKQLSLSLIACTGACPEMPVKISAYHWKESAKFSLLQVAPQM